MARKQQLNDLQIAALYDPPTEQRDLIRHYTLSESDLTLIRRCRGDHSRLGYALMLCFLRFPGRPLRPGEQPPEVVVSFVAEQIDVLTNTIDEVPGADQSRRRHAADLQDRLGIRPFGTRAAKGLAEWLVPYAAENDQLFHLATLVIEEARRRQIVLPPTRTLERVCIDARYRGRREIDRRLTDGLSPETKRQLDDLLSRRKDTSLTWLAWLRQMPEATKAATMLGLTERLAYLRVIGLDMTRGQRVHQARLGQLAREAARTTAQHILGYERQRRHAALVAIVLDLQGTLTDHAVDLFDRLIGMMFRKTEERHARAFQADARAINDKVRLFANIGTALIVAKKENADPFAAIDAILPWEKFQQSVAEAEALTRPEAFDPYENLGEYYAGLRRWAPAFLDMFTFQSVPASRPLMRAIGILRELNAGARSSLPNDPPVNFVRQRWSRHVFVDGRINRRYYELCVLSELRDRLRAGDVWVEGSPRYRSFEERLLSRKAVQELERAGTLPVAVDTDVERYLEAQQQLLDRRLAAIDAKAREGLLPDVTLEKGVLKITPIDKSTPPEAEALAARLYAMLPRVRITDLLAEVARWTMFPDCFTHLRTGEPATNPHSLMASLLADGLNLGLTRMAEASSIATLGQLAWTSEWHVREETYAAGLQVLVNKLLREPLATLFGSGTASSSDGQFFRAGGVGTGASAFNAHYGDVPGTKFYTHISDRFAPFYTKVITATASEALHVLDGLLYHQSEVSAQRHHTDGGGDSDHVFALCALLGFVFAPRIPDLKSRKLFSFSKPSSYPTLEPLIGGRINVGLIRSHWPDILRIVASIRTGTVTASLIMRQLAAFPRQNGLAAALREVGRLHRTQFTLDWIEDIELRRNATRELNKGEARHSLARAVFIHRLGEIRDRTYENQQYRASGLNLLVTAIILWNTRYLDRAITALRQVETVPDELLKHLSPLGWEHINLTGDYIWSSPSSDAASDDGFQPLRPVPDITRLAA